MTSALPTPAERFPECLEHFLVLIPAWNPDARLIALVEELVRYGFAAILVIDDGSASDSLPIFEHLRTHRTIQVLRHDTNMGKGRALKTGFRYVVNALPWVEGVITADADGQHAAADIVAVANAMRDGGDHVTLGVRTFTKDIPLRNLFGNVLTRYIFGLVTGINASDAQTGLRAFPRSLLPELENLPGEHYEYEMSVLTYICLHFGKPREIGIRTIYFKESHSSHFHPLWDSMRIYFSLVRFYFSSLIR